MSLWGGVQWTGRMVGVMAAFLNLGTTRFICRSAWAYVWGGFSIRTVGPSSPGILQYTAKKYRMLSAASSFHIDRITNQ